MESNWQDVSIKVEDIRPFDEFEENCKSVCCETKPSDEADSPADDGFSERQTLLPNQNRRPDLVSWNFYYGFELGIGLTFAALFLFYLAYILFLG